MLMGYGVPDNQIYEVIIVGGGPAGLTAGLYCKRAALKTVLFERGLLGGQIAVAKEVENYPGLQDITGFDLAEKLVLHAKAFNLNIVNKEVEEVRPGTDYHTVRLAGEGELHSRALILALGGTARKLGIPGEAEYFGSGVSYCATCDGFFFRDRTVIVVGGGDTAVEEALYLAKLTGKVTLVHKEKALIASRILQNRILAEKGIKIIGNTTVTEIKGNGQAVEAVSLKDTETGETRELPAEGVFIFIGYAPNNRLIPPEIKMDEQGFVITNSKCATNIPGIFVAGDLRQKFASQIVVAAADGAIAALAAAAYVEERKGIRME